MRNDRYILELCGNICFLREKQKMSKEEMSNLLGIDLSAMTEIERGSLPSGLTCAALARLSQRFDAALNKLFLPLDGVGQ